MYNTISQSVDASSSGGKATMLVAVVCTLLGAAAGLMVTSNLSALYAPAAIKTVNAIPAAPVALPSRLIRTDAGSVVAASKLDSPVSSPVQEMMPAIFGGLAIAAVAGVAAAATHFFRGVAKAGRGDLLAKYQAAEANWSMAAATAFVGTKAPDFQATAVFDEEFVDIKLSQYRGKKYVVLFFYPLDFTFVCPTEITAFSDREAEFSAIDTQILGVSVDSQFSHLAWVQTPRNQGGLGEITYPLVADLKKEIAEAYGVLTEDGVALRGLFIIDKEGIIQHATINNLAFGRNVDETLRVLEAVQHVQANPDEVCPAGWKKGDRTMKPDPEGSKEYFKAI